MRNEPISSRIVVVTGTGTNVGKTYVTAALASEALARGLRVSVIKAAQTGVAPGEPGDVAEIERLAPGVRCVEGPRYPDPLAPETAARRAGMPAVTLEEVTRLVAGEGEHSDLILVEGAGGVAVRFSPTVTIAEVAVALEAPVLVVARAGLGTLSDTELACERLRLRGASILGVVCGAGPDLLDGTPPEDLAIRCNVEDLPRVTGVPFLGSLPRGARWAPGGRVPWVSVAVDTLCSRP